MKTKTKKAHVCNSSNHWSMYKKLRNYANHKEKNLKSRHFGKLIEHAKGDGGVMSRAIKQVLLDEKKSTVCFHLRERKVAF